jgi:hypothetical protein
MEQFESLPSQPYNVVSPLVTVMVSKIVTYRASGGNKGLVCSPHPPSMPVSSSLVNITCSLVANQASGSAHIDGRTIPSLRQASSWLYDSPNRCFNTHDGQCHSTFTCPSHKRGCVESIIHRLVATHNAHVPKWAFRTTPGDRRSDSLGDDSRTSYRRGNNVDTCFSKRRGSRDSRRAVPL